ncbi:MAG: hypothetical protein AAF408_11430 [Pseudomonadota bacterium]
MLVFSQQALAFIAVPKTGTTAIEMALKRKADIIFTKERKHITAQRFHNRIAPFLDEVFDLRPDRFAVMRDPEQQISSWYRYRTRDALAGTPRYTGDISFDEFVRRLIKEDAPRHTGVGSQLRMLASQTGEVLVHHLFRYENWPRLELFLEQRFGEEVEMKDYNRSPKGSTDLDPATRAGLRRARSAEFELYDRLAEADGYLRTEIG